MKTVDVSIIIVTRNGWEVTRKCLHSLRDVACREVIVVDNGSTDGTVKGIQRWQYFPITLLRNSENTGFAPANNMGLAVAKGKFVLFLNNDTVVNANFLPQLVRSLSGGKKIAAVQPMILFPDGTIDSIGSYLTPTGFLYHRAHRLMPDKHFLKQESVYTLKGACMLWKHSVLDRIGGFDDSFFAYFEETELCHRAMNYGYQVFVDPTVAITHLGGFTSNTMDRPFVQYHNAKNRFITYLKHLPMNLLLPILGIHFLLCEALVAKTLLQDRSVALAVQKGIIVGILRGWQERRRWKRNRTDKLPLKFPDAAYYLALFSSLKAYSKIW